MYHLVLQTAEDEADYQRIKADLAAPINGNPISDYLNAVGTQSAEDEMALFRAAARS
jgi:hypothetical protein